MSMSFVLDLQDLEHAATTGWCISTFSVVMG